MRASLALLLLPFAVPPAQAGTSVVAIIPVSGGSSPSGIAANPITNKVYVGVSGAGEVSIIDGASNTIVKNVNFLGAPFLGNLAVNTVTNKIYVANNGNGTADKVFVINGATDTQITGGGYPITVGTGPRWIGINPVANRVYVGNENTNNVTVINGATDVPITTVAVGGSPAGIGVHTGTSKVYVALKGANSVQAWDAGFVGPPVDIPGMSDPNDLVVDSVANRAYVANAGNNTVSVINTLTDTVVSTFAVGGAPYGIALNPGRTRAYVANGATSNVSVVNTLSGVIDTTVGIQLIPRDAEYNAGNGLVYAANFAAGSVSVLADVGELCGEATSWWNSAWRRKRQITINNGALSGSYTHFPLLVKLDPSRIDYSKTLAGGADLRFVDADDFTVLDYEIERWTPGGTSYVWVRVPQIPGTSLDSIYMYFDNPAAGAGQNPAGVWGPSAHNLVQHLEETAGAHLDSATADGAANDSVVVDVQPPQGNAVGQINGADLFSAASTDNIDVADSAVLNAGGGDSFTVEAWIKTTTTGAFQHIASKEGAGAGWDLMVWSSNEARFTVYDNGPGASATAQAVVVTDGNWHYVVGRWDRATATAQLFVDGFIQNVDTEPALAGSSFANAEPFVIGEEGDTNRGFNFDGTIDEVRFSKTLRSNDWIRAQYLSMTDNYTWFGPEKGQCNFRSIGTRANYGTGHAAGLGTTVTATQGSRTVTGAGGTLWRTNNRGRGDAILIDLVPYTVAAVNSETQLTLTTPYAGTTGGGKSYAIQRMYGTLQEWENCIDGLANGGACVFFPPASNDLVADNRGEVGIAYNDSPVPANADFTASVTIDGSVTDAVHTITLTADWGNQNRGLAGAGTLIDNGNSVAAVRILDDYVTVSWLEIRGGLLTVDGIIVDTQGPSNGIKLHNLLIHDVPGDGIEIVDPDSIVDVYNTIIYSAAQRGILISAGALTASSRVRLLNNTIYNVLNEANFQSFGATNPTVLLRNNIARHYLVPAPSAASSHNLSMDATATSHSPAGGGESNVLLSSIAFVNSAPASADLHLRPESYARDKAANLSALFPGDIDDGPRTAPWDIGADEQEPGVAAGCPYGTGPVGANLAPNPAFAIAGGGPAAQPAVGAGFVIHPSAPSQYAGDNIRAVDGEMAIFTGAYQWPSGGPPWTIDQAPFPGDAGLGVAAAGSYLVANGNPFAPAPMMVWQTRNAIAVSPNTTYTFFAYASNLISLTEPAVDPPRLVFRKSAASCVPGPCVPTDLNVTPFVVPQETVADTWTRYGVNFTTGPAETQAFLSLWDAGISIFGVDLGVTQFGVYQCAPTTAVTLQSFVALPQDGAVLLSWRTGSELTNLGFHVYRSLSEKGPWTRLTSSLIPGLGSSAVGQAYAFRDVGLENGTRYFYRLDDVDAASKVTSHGPVSAVPAAGAEGGGNGRDKKQKNASASCPDWVLAASGSTGGESPRCTRHGDPEAVSLTTLSRDERQATLELRTGGFYALHTPSGAGDPSGTVRVFVPGFDFPQDDDSAALPVRRALADAVVGRRVQLGGVRALDLASFAGLVPSALGKAEMQVGRDGTVRAARRGARTASRAFPRSQLATLLPSLFQGEKKSAVVEIAPLRFDAQRRQLVLSKRVLVKLLFTGREAGESGRGSFGRAPGTRQVAPSGEVLARLHTTSRGLHSVTFEQLLPTARRGLAVSELKLQRQGAPVGFHVEPAAASFGPGSRLYFYADAAAASTDYAAELAYELVRARDGVRMPLAAAAPGSGTVTSEPVVTRAFETDRFYQPGLLDAPDPWLWEAIPSGATRVKPFSLTLVSAAGTASLDVFLQGASESGAPADHHLSVSLNGTLVGEAQFAGKQAYRMSLTLPASLLREGSNDLSLTNVADTGVSSLVFLDRFSLAHPQASQLADGRLEATWAESGTAVVSGVSAGLALLDVTPSTASASGTATPRWLTGHQASGGSLRFQAEAGRRYLVVSPQALVVPRVSSPEPTTLRAATNQADYLLIAPRAFLSAAEPLLDRRQDQGLSTRGVAFEDIASEFGHGRPSAEAIKSFVAHAFHSWSRPSPRYVLLLGDASYDPRNFIGTSQPSPLPALWTKTSYLWTVSDPRLAAVNGEDALPDLAIGRLPATTLEQADALVRKLLAWEDSRQGLRGAAALVADNPDVAGDFEHDVRDIAESYLSEREPSLLLLRDLGPELRPRIQDALDSGLSYLSYVGHGGAAVWASENVWNSWDAASLQAQSQQPLLVTMNCLNGYFVAPAFESLSESLLKAEGRGAIASFSPSGLSLDGPAHQYHRALMAELTSGRHATLGDAILAAQKTYADSGLMPELLGVYHLLGDPATRIR